MLHGTPRECVTGRTENNGQWAHAEKYDVDTTGSHNYDDDLQYHRTLDMEDVVHCMLMRHSNSILLGV